MTLFRAKSPPTLTLPLKGGGNRERSCFYFSLPFDGEVRGLFYFSLPFDGEVRGLFNFSLLFDGELRGRFYFSPPPRGGGLGWGGPATPPKGPS